MAVRFDKYEKRGAYHWQWYADNTFDYRDHVQMILDQLPHAGTAIDIGGGDGLITYKLFAHGLKTTCIDTNAAGIALAHHKMMQQIYGDQWGNQYRVWRMLKPFGLFKNDLARRYHTGGVRLITGSIFEDLPPGARYDYSICHEVIEHVPDPERLIDIICEITTQFAIISTPNALEGRKGDYDHNLWTPEEFVELLGGRPHEFLQLTGKTMYIRLDTYND